MDLSNDCPVSKCSSSPSWSQKNCAVTCGYCHPLRPDGCMPGYELTDEGQCLGKVDIVVVYVPVGIPVAIWQQKTLQTIYTLSKLIKHHRLNSITTAVPTWMTLYERELDPRVLQCT